MYTNVNIILEYRGATGPQRKKKKREKKKKNQRPKGILISKRELSTDNRYYFL